MKKLFLLLLVTISLAGCKDYSEDINSLNARVTKLEEWQKTANENISALQSITTALQNEDYVTSVTQLADSTGYTINFKKSGSVTIYNGKDGVSPMISVGLYKGSYYWMLNGDWITDYRGYLIPTSGEAIVPKVRINNGVWEISTDGGNLWKSTDIKASSIFKDVDNSNFSYLVLTMNDGTSLKLQRYKAFKIGTDEGNDVLPIFGTTDIDLLLPSDFKLTDYTAIMAQITNNIGTSTDIQSRATTDLWTVSVTKPAYSQGTYNSKVTVKLPTNFVSGDMAMLEVTLVDNDGSKIVATRALKALKLYQEYNAIGSGTEADPYQIYTKLQLQSLATAVNSGKSMEGIYFKQMIDISLVDYSDWTPIGNSESNSFKGYYDGNGQKITNLNIKPSSDAKYGNVYLGLFGCVDGGSVTSLTVSATIEAPQFDWGTKYLGSIIGYLKSGSVKELAANATITATTSTLFSESEYVGGAIGKSEIELNPNIFNVSCNIHFGIDGSGSGGYVGHNVGDCPNSFIANGQRKNDDSISIIKEGDFAALYINGNRIYI